MRSFDLTPLLRSSIGFENLSRLAEFAGRSEDGGGYPPYNIEKLGENEYRIQMAAAGFAEDELELTVQDNVLIVSGRAGEETEDREFLHRGIAKRAFERRFQLAEIIKVTEATFENGLLNIGLVREIPEHKKPRKIHIGGKQGPQSIEGQSLDGKPAAGEKAAA
ncbi:Hsp20 family protein [Pacificimonas flava]|uniref:Heat shock protein A n=1 Tax=Pacificimonas flava TaxID=1234595 RepID=M2SDP9_9SPHN|nr:Hsp20 family protein [Pacificimonas flava]EMD83495.1 heat shock protein A [Pacificimonas flava]MBB5278950.1 molecular chaperone IbpA [Pacificimonas flava]